VSRGFVLKAMTCYFTCTAHRWLQSRSKHVSIGSNCGLQRVTGNAVLAVDLYLNQSIILFVHKTYDTQETANKHYTDRNIQTLSSYGSP